MSGASVRVPSRSSGGSKRQVTVVGPLLPSNSPTVAYTLPTVTLIRWRSPRIPEVEPSRCAIVQRALLASLPRTRNWSRRSVVVRPSRMPSGLALSATT